MSICTFIFIYRAEYLGWRAGLASLPIHNEQCRTSHPRSLKRTGNTFEARRTIKEMYWDRSTSRKGSRVAVLHIDRQNLYQLGRHQPHLRRYISRFSIPNSASSIQNQNISQSKKKYHASYTVEILAIFCFIFAQSSLKHWYPNWSLHVTHTLLHWYT